MKLTRGACYPLVLVLSLLVFAFSPGAPRAQAASGTTTVSRFHGLSVFAFFNDLSPNGCIDTSVSVDSFQNTDNHQTTHGADIFISQYDQCSGTTLLGASGSTLNPDFQIKPDLTSASLKMTLSVADYVSGRTFDVSVNLTWTSTSALTHSRSTFHYHTRGFTENGFFNNDSRDANAAGTVSDGTTNFSPLQSIYAQTMLARSANVTITHP
jgi:hypothetical protein